MAGDGLAGTGAAVGPLGEVDGPVVPGEGVGVEALGLRLVLLVVHAEAEDVLPGHWDGGEDADGGEGDGRSGVGAQGGVPVGGIVRQEGVHVGVGEGAEGAVLGPADQGPAPVGYGIELHGSTSFGSRFFAPSIAPSEGEVHRALYKGGWGCYDILSGISSPGDGAAEF